MEKWRDVVEWEGVYEVSDKGRVRRTAPGTGAVAGRVLRPGLHTSKKYYIVALCRDSKARTKTVHRLVAEAFLTPPPLESSRVVAHRNGNGLDNRVDNLYWATPSENMRDQVLHGTAKGAYNPARQALTSEDVRAIRQDPRPAAHVARDYALHPTTVTQIRRRDTYRHVARAAGDYTQKRPRRRFTVQEVRDIRGRAETSTRIAKDYNVSLQTISALRKRATYAWVDPLPDTQ